MADLVMIVFAFVLATPLWLPIAFGAYAVGRRRFTLWTLLVFVSLESASFGTVAWAWRRGLSNVIATMYYVFDEHDDVPASMPPVVPMMPPAHDAE
jgi:hypothetical protein